MSREVPIGGSIRFAIVFWVVNLHLLRNLFGAAYLVVYGLVVAMVVVDFATARPNKSVRLDLFVVWMLIASSGALASIFTIGVIGAGYGFVRFTFAVPIFLALVAYTRSAHDLRKHVSTMVLFFTLAVITIPLQFITGPIGWFVADSERAGLERYGSLLGSLTAVGVVAGSYLVLTNHKTLRVALPLWAVQLVGVLTSLSKAALGNAGLAIAVVIWLRRREMSKMLVAGLVLLVALVLTFAYYQPAADRLEASMASFGIASTSSPANFDQSATEGAVDRVTRLPQENFDALETLNSPFVYLVGGGFGMASTALVPQESALAPMSHNQFAELVTVFGFLGGGAALVILGLIFVRLRGHSRVDRLGTASCILGAYALWFLNSIFANGTAYQPASASILFLALYASCARTIWLPGAVPESVKTLGEVRRG